MTTRHYQAAIDAREAVFRGIVQKHLEDERHTWFIAHGETWYAFHALKRLRAESEQKPARHEPLYRYGHAVAEYSKRLREFRRIDRTFADCRRWLG
jgi:hypothetical protein